MFGRRFSREWVRSTTQRRARPWGCRRRVVGSSPRCGMCGTYPRPRTAWSAGCPLYPLSPQRCWRCSSGGGRRMTTCASVGTRSTTSCRCAPLTMRDSGIQLPSTRRLRLVPFFPPIRRVRPDGFEGERRFDHGPIDALPAPGDALQVVILGEAVAPEPDEHVLPLPGQEVLVDRTRAPELPLGEGLPLDAGAQDEDDRLEDLPGLPGLGAPAGGGGDTPPLLPLPRGDEGFYLGPQLIGDGPRLD